MRVLIHTLPQKPHVYMATPLAWALRAAGHEVRLVTAPDLESVVQSAGHLATVLDEPDRDVADEMTASQNPRTPSSAKQRQPRSSQTDYVGGDAMATYAEFTGSLLPTISPKATIDSLVAFTRSWSPDLIVWDMLAYAGPIAARATNTPHVRLLLGTDGLAQLRGHLAGGDAQLAGDPLRTWLSPHLARWHGGSFDEDVIYGQATIDLMPPWTWHPASPPNVQIPMRHVPYNGGAKVPEWVDQPSDRPRVCISLGHSHRDANRPEASAANILEAAAQVDAEVVATLDARQLPDRQTVPPNVRLVDFVPLGALLPTCSAIVHHGGGGTFATAIEHGVPQLIVPSSWWTERFFGPVAMAEGIEAQGAGLYVGDSSEIAPDPLRDCIQEVLGTSRYAHNAQRLERDVRLRPTPADVSRHLHTFANGNRRTPR